MELVLSERNNGRSFFQKRHVTPALNSAKIRDLQECGFQNMGLTRDASLAAFDVLIISVHQLIVIPALGIRPSPALTSSRLTCSNPALCNLFVLGLTQDQCWVAHS